MYDDQRKLDLAKAEPNLRLFLMNRVNAAAAADGVIDSVVAQDIRSGRRQRIRGRWFVDATGDGVLGALVGADFEMTTGAHLGAATCGTSRRSRKTNIN